MRVKSCVNSIVKYPTINYLQLILVSGCFASVGHRLEIRSFNLHKLLGPIHRSLDIFPADF